MQNDQKGFSIIEGFLIIVVLGIFGLVGWYIYHKNSVAKIPDGYLLYSNQQLDIQFVYQPGNGEPVITESDSSTTSSGKAYVFSQPNYGDAATIILGSKNLKYSKDEDGFDQITNLLFGDITADFNSTKQSIISLDASRRKANEVVGYTMLLESSANQVTYVTFDSGASAYLTTIKHIPSNNRTANISFTYRVDTSTIYKGNEDAKTPISSLIEATDLEFFNSVTNSISSYRP